MDDPFDDDTAKTPPQSHDFTVLREYHGTAEETASELAAERPALVASGYTFAGETFTRGHWPWWRYLLSVVLIPLLIGFAMLGYLLLTPAPGRRSVTLMWSGFPDAMTHTPLVRPGAIAQAIDRARAELGAETGAALESELSFLAAYLSSLAEDASSAMRGDPEAAARLRFALRSARASQAPNVPSSSSGSPDAGTGSVVDRDQLAVLAAGVTWAARSSAEAHSMLATLAAQLVPLAAVQAALAPGVHPAQLQAMMVSGGLALPGLGSFGGLGGLVAGGFPGLPPIPIGPGLPRPPGQSFWPGLIGWLFPGRPVWIPKYPWDSRPVFFPPFLYDTDKVCAELAVFTVFTIQQISTRYRIDSVTPPAACGGSRPLRLKGTGFGPGGIVLFPTTDGPDVRAPVNALTWTDTEITFRMPSNAAPGEIRLQVIEKTVTVCHSNLTVHRLGTGIGFAGGQVRVFSITANGETGACLAPNTDVTIEWVTTAAPTHSVAVTVEAPGAAPVTTTRTAVGADSMVYRTPDVTTPVVINVTVTVTGNCEPVEPSRSATFNVSVPSRLSVRGIEVTQGVQRFNLIAPVAPLQTAAGKATIVRAYLNCDRKGFARNRLTNVTGSLRIEGGPTLQPIGDPATTTAQPWTAILRYQIGDTLNFRIPAAFSVGTQRLFVNVWGTDECGTHHGYGEITWQWEPQPPLRVRYVLVRDERPGSATPGRTPSDGQARALVVRAMDLLPTPPTDIAPAPIIEITATEDWKTSDGRRVLLGLLDLFSSCIPFESVWPWSEPCSNDGTTWAAIYFEPDGGGQAKLGGHICVAGLSPFSLAHELGHTLGLKHVITGQGDTVPDGPYDQLPIDGFVADTVVDPSGNPPPPPSLDPPRPTIMAGPVYDLMSYAPIRWTSATNWARMMGII